MMPDSTPNLTAILQDLANNGVTDIMGETAHDWFAKPVKTNNSTSSRNSSTQQPYINTPKQLEPKKIVPTPIEKPRKVISPVLTGEAGQLLVITGSLENSPPLTADETELLSNMLKAINISISKTAILAVPVADKYGTPFADIAAYKKELQKPVQKIITTANPPAILALGQIAAHITMGKDLPLSEAREQAALTCNAKLLGITYHPRTLLKQPLLKRMAWQDLLNFKNKLEQA